MMKSIYHEKTAKWNLKMIIEKKDKKKVQILEKHIRKEMKKGFENHNKKAKSNH